MRTGTKRDLEMRTLAGPSVFAPFAAIVAEFAIPTPMEPSRGGTLPKVICAGLPDAVMARIQTLERSAPFETLVAGLAQALQIGMAPTICRARSAALHRVEGWYIWDITMSRLQRKPCNWVMN